MYQSTNFRPHSNPEVHYSVHKIPPPVPIVSQKSPINPIYLNFILMLSSHQRLGVWYSNHYVSVSCITKPSKLKTSVYYREIYEVCPENYVPLFSEVNIYSKNYGIYTYSSAKVCIQTQFFHVSVNIYRIAPTRKKCVHALSVKFLVLLLFVSGWKWWTQASSDVKIQDNKAYEGL
jgi:hypothetical protein